MFTVHDTLINAQTMSIIYSYIVLALCTDQINKTFACFNVAENVNFGYIDSPYFSFIVLNVGTGLCLPGSFLFQSKYRYMI